MKMSVGARRYRMIGWRTRDRFRLVLATLAFLLPVTLAHASLERLFAPGKDLWTRWAAHDEGSTRQVDHGVFDAFLRAYVVEDRAGVNRVAYARVTRADRDRLRSYLGGLANVPVARLNRREQLAYWINLYNALTLQVVLEHYPVASIRDIDISPGLLADGPWGRPLIAVGGEALTLNDIEHRILRPIWNDPRIHYAVNCASVGCPNLQGMAFTGANVEALLEDGARRYVNNPRGARVDGGKLVVSKIYDWFQEDFGGSESGVIAHLRRYAAPPLAAALQHVQEIGRYEYDWSLNDAGRNL